MKQLKTSNLRYTYIRNKEYRKLNKDKVSKQARERRKKRKLRVIEILGGKCVRCGIDDIRCLQVDHIYGGGLTEFNKLGTYGIRKNIINNPEDAGKKYQLLCANCNWIKRWEEREYN